MKIKLKAQGVLVHEAEIPMFKLCPHVIVWGNRTFEWDLSTSTMGAVSFEECFAYALPDAPPDSAPMPHVGWPPYSSK